MITREKVFKETEQGEIDRFDVKVGLQSNVASVPC